MSPLQKHIVDSLEKEKVEILNILAYQKAITDQGISYTGEKDWALNKILKLREQSLLQLLEIARGEVEKLNSFETEDFVFPTAIKRQDVLDTLTISNQSKNN